MKKENTPEIEDELRPEYDLAELLKSGVRGKYVERYRAGLTWCCWLQMSLRRFRLKTR